MAIRSCRSDELAQLTLLLDEAFIYSKGRAISLRLRFPTVFCPDNLDNLLICSEDGVIASALAMRQFDWRDGGNVLRGAMIGAVYTQPARRGEGLASRLLAAAVERMRENGVDFGVLWTSQPSFYARLGWVAADCSVLGEIGAGQSMPEPPGEVIITSAVAAAPQLDSLRSKPDNATILRSQEDYRQLPLPVEHVVLLHCGGTAIHAYALFGSSGETGFLYELAGDIHCFPALWREACRHCRRILVNDRTGSISYRWLSDHTRITWQSKHLAMWLPLSKRVDMSCIEKWHIPYFDRI